MQSTIRSRELGLAISRAAKATGLTGSAIARRLGWSDSKVSRLLLGKFGVSREDLSAMLAVCGIAPPKRDELMELVRHAYQPSWWQEYGDRLPVELTTLTDHEDSAIAITGFQTDCVPGLLHTDDYMRAMLRACPIVPDTEIGVRVEARKRRQSIFDRRSAATRFRFFIDEYALIRTGPGHHAMSATLHHLLRMSVRRHVEIRVIPDVVGFHAGHRSFHMMEFAEWNPVVHLENWTSSQFLERDDTVAAFRRTVAELDKVALAPDHSRAWMSDLASTLAHGVTERLVVWPQILPSS